MFGCSQTVIPEGVLRIVNVFDQCKDLTKIMLPKSLKTIGRSTAFYCENLTDIVFSDGLKKIESCAFVGCNNLRKITLPKSLEYIGSEAFEDCDLCEVTILSPYLKDLSGVFGEKVKIIYAAEEPADVNVVEMEEVIHNDEEDDCSYDNEKPIRVLVFAKGDNAKAAVEAGADYVGAEELIPKIQEDGWLEFDVVVTTPDMMGVVGRLSRVLGPKGLLPNPRGGTLTMDVAKTVRELKEGKLAVSSSRTFNESINWQKTNSVTSATNNKTSFDKDLDELLVQKQDQHGKGSEFTYNTSSMSSHASRKKVYWVPLFALFIWVVIVVLEWLFCVIFI